MPSSVPSRLFTRRFVAGSLANATLATCFFLTMTSIAGYVNATFHTPPALAGIVSGLFVLAATAGRLVAGPLVIMFGRRLTVLGSVAVFLVASSLYCVAATLAHLVAVRIMHGLAMGIASTVAAAVALSKVPPGRQGEASGWFGAGIAVSGGIGPLGGAAVVARWGYEAVFGLGCLVAAVTFVLVFVASLDVPRRPAHARFRRPHWTLATFFAAPAFPIGLVVALPACGFGAVLTYLNAHAATRGLEAAAGWFFLVYAVVIVVARPLAGLVQDRRGNDIVVVPALLLAAVGFAVTAWGHTPLGLLAGALTLGLGYGTLISAGQAVAIRRSGSLNVSMAVGSFFVLVDSGTGGGPAVLGTVAQHAGYPAMFLVAAGLAVLALVVYGVWVADARRRVR